MVVVLMVAILHVAPKPIQGINEPLTNKEVPQFFTDMMCLRVSGEKETIWAKGQMVLSTLIFVVYAICLTPVSTTK